MANIANRGTDRKSRKDANKRIKEAIKSIQSLTDDRVFGSKSKQIAWAIDSVIAVGGIIPVDDMWKIVEILEEYKDLAEACEDSVRGIPQWLPVDYEPFTDSPSSTIINITINNK